VRMFPVAILAGGLATRLRPITERIPKALIEIAGRPFIYHQLELLKRQGIDRVVLCVGYLGDHVKTAVGDGKMFGLSITYSFDGDTLLGTGGALKQALSCLDDDFFVLYGDSYLPCSFSDVQSAYAAAKCPALMTALRNNGLWDKSNVLFKDGKLMEYNKRYPRSEMDYVDYGLGILSAGVFSGHAEHEPFDLADVYHELSLKGQLAGFEVSGRFYEIGSNEGIKETEAFLLPRER
jgi:N-acetyl-alpha-D-muramate 1-phosphate uridylyltransferase